jgi:hypothetical protein
MKELLVRGYIYITETDELGESCKREVLVFSKRVKARTYKEAMEKFNFRGTWCINVKNEKIHKRDKCFHLKDDSVNPSFSEKV